MAKGKSTKEKLFGAAVLKMSFRLRGDEESPAFQFVYPGVLRDLELNDAAVEKYIAENRDAVERAARGKASDPECTGDPTGIGYEPSNLYDCGCCYRSSARGRWDPAIVRTGRAAGFTCFGTRRAAHAGTSSRISHKLV